MNLPETHYAQSGVVNIAYQVLGTGRLDLVVVPGFTSNVEYEWQEPRIAAYRQRLARSARVILFDKRGTGLSDQIHGIPTLEERMDDVRAVIDAARSERAVVLGTAEGGAMTALVAATYPSRTLGVILYNAYAYRPLERESLERLIEGIPRRWGTQDFADEDLRIMAPSVASEPELRRWAPSWIRFSATPAAFIALMRMRGETDVRHVLPAIRVPTLVLHRSGDRLIPPKYGRELAELIPTADYVELPGVDHYPWVGEIEPLVREIERFIRGLSEEAAFDRVLTTLLFTDIVGSTSRAAVIGDREWSKLVSAHHAVVRAHLARFRGREIDTAGDGFLVSFDGPGRAVRCASAILRSVRELGLDVRAGVHTGECQLVGEQLRGIAVHLAARIAARALPGEVLVSSTVKDLVAGSGLRFDDRGLATLKGAPDKWRLYAAITSES